MAATEDVLVRLRALGQRAFQRDMEQSAKATEKVGSASELASKKGVAAWKKYAAGAAALYTAKKLINATVGSTMQLAKATLAVQRGTNLDTKTASQWAEVTKVRGIAATAFQRGLVTLSKGLEGARTGSKTATAAFKALGVSQSVIASGNVNEAILQSADAFAALQNPAQKAALAQKLFGRAGITMLPLLNQGSQGIRDQMEMAERYGAVISDTKDAKQMIANQREMTYALDGLKITVGTALIPVLNSLGAVVIDLTRLFQPIMRNATVMKVVFGMLAVAFITYKVAVIASTIATLGFNAAFLLIPLAIAAVIAGLIILYTKWGWFHNAVDNAFRWIKANWPLLLSILVGPFGAAVIYIIRHFDKIKQAVTDTVAFIKKKFTDLKNFIKRLPGSIFGKVGGVLGKVVPHAAGGVVRRGETSLVGEYGPELLTPPGGSRIMPLPAGLLAGFGQTTAHFYLDRRVIATAVAQADADQRARR